MERVNVLYSNTHHGTIAIMIVSFLETTFPLQIWTIEILNNTVSAYAAAAILFITTLLVLKLFKQYLFHRLKTVAHRTKTGIDELVLNIFDSFPWWFLIFLSAAAAYTTLQAPEWLDQSVFIVLVALLVYQTTIIIQVIIDHIIKIKLDGTKDKGKVSGISMFGNIIKGAVWIVAILFALSNMGINITSLIAGLGIGGVAIAFALQNILGDLFSSFAIYFDKPFSAGDFIIIGDHMGTVERIGIKTTRLRSLQGEEIIVSNRELTTARVRNFRTLNERRVVFSFRVTYQTPQNKLERIPHIVQKIIDDTPNIRFDRAHLKEFGESAFVFEVVYHVLNRGYGSFMDANQHIHFALRKAFTKEKISFAYQTRTIHVDKTVV